MGAEPSVSSYLTVRNAKALLAFYQTVFDADILGTLPAEDGERLMHATVSIHGTNIMLADEFPEHGGDRAPDIERGSPVALSLRLASAEEVDTLYEKALAHGATERWKPDNMFWGDRFAQFIDPSGHRWMLVAKLES